MAQAYTLRFPIHCCAPVFGFSSLLDDVAQAPFEAPAMPSARAKTVPPIGERSTRPFVLAQAAFHALAPRPVP